MAETKKTETAKKEVAVPKPAKVKSKTGPRGPRKDKAAPKAEHIHVGKMIERKMKTQHLNKNKLAKMLKLTPPTVSQIVKARSLHTDRLIELSEALKYNFFAELSTLINVDKGQAKPVEAVSDSKINNLQGQIADLELELRFLREENTYLKRIIELLAGGKK